ncbi:hypothetical protein [Sediminibacterium goheungense]|uniref:Uncharacterized protein n=1 Tax=Sediminibacterium goheungense TaxID=1086393 RepID=A0A4R6J2G6_9BACT|nr:hypothetical protein [Sediminibacterium goheungense]TDO28971.1 hypothetical protein BC659_1053 [Sediminibacterium goheungense]
MKKWKAISIPGKILLVLLIGSVICFFLLPNADKFEFIGAIFLTVFSYEGLCLLFPESFLERFKKKERNPLIEE